MTIADPPCDHWDDLIGTVSAGPVVFRTGDPGVRRWPSVVAHG